MIKHREPFETVDEEDIDNHNNHNKESIIPSELASVDTNFNKENDDFTLKDPPSPITSNIDVKIFPYKHALPVHTKIRPSILAKEAPAQNYRGFFTLAVLVLIATNVRLIIENFLKYGVLIALPSETILELDWQLFIALQIFQQFTCLLGLLIEKMLVRRIPASSPTEGATITLSKRQKTWLGLHFINIMLIIVVPTFIVYNVMFHPLLGCLTMGHSIVLALKLISFVCVNSDLRHAYRTGNNYSPYPENLTMANYYYFQVAPTLCYQVSYPRSPSIRYGFLFKRVAEYLLCTLMMYFLTLQYAVPTLQNSLKVQGSSDPPLIFVIERVLKLSTISVLVWLLGFYSIFHSFLNALAEILQFGDRNFYQPWWNSSSLSEYWRLWNQPVHHWMKRHLYVPGVSAGYPSWVMLGLSFFFSAVFHELLFGVAVHALQGYAFWGMLGQIPLIMISSLLVKWRGPTSLVGNVVFWLSFCIIGQPCLVVLYYYDWTRRNPTSI